MRALFLLMVLISVKVAASDQAWVSQNCPRCYQTSDQNFLFRVDDQIIKFSPRNYGKEEKLQADFVEVEWIGIANTKGAIIEENATFPTTSDREHFLSKYKRLCQLFTGYEYFQSEISFTQGDYQSDPNLSTTGKVKLTCTKSLTESEAAQRALARSRPEVKESVSGLVNFLTGSKTKKKNLGIYDESRGEEARNPRGTERLPASAGVVGK
jgi:hypothetical protein